MQLDFLRYSETLAAVSDSLLAAALQKDEGQKAQLTKLYGYVDRGITYLK